MAVALKQKIRDAIVIPPRLANNMAIATRLGGVFLEYCSDTTNILTALNSRVQVKMHFPDTGRFGNYVGDVCGLAVIRAIGIKAPRNINKYDDYRKVIGKVNKWLDDNEEFLYYSIENK